MDITKSLKDMHLCSPSLPLEMIENIIDHGCKDPRLLKACSLVCKDWLGASRLHLFSLVKHTTITPENSSRFIRLVHSPHSTLPAFFHTFCFKGLTHDALVSIINSIQDALCIRTLVILGPESMSALSTSIMQCGTLQQTVTRIDLRFVGFDSHLMSSLLRDVLKTIFSFSALERLDLSGSVASIKQEAFKDITVPSTLNTIQLCMTRGLDVMVNYCLVSHATLTRLRVHNFQAKDSQTFQDYINTCTTLRHLTIDHNPFENRKLIVCTVIYIDC